MIFLDSSFIIASKLDGDEHHQKAMQYLIKLIREGNQEFTISDYIFDEVVTVVFGRSKNLSTAIDIGNVLKSSFYILNINREIFNRAWEIFQEQKKPN